jgi:hypothetical protein
MKKNKPSQTATSCNYAKLKAFVLSYIDMRRISYQFFWFLNSAKSREHVDT